MKRLLLLVLSLTGVSGAAGAPALEARARSLEQVLLAPCCFAGPVATHQSEASARMKIEIARLLADGKSDQEIIDLYKKRYGDRIYAPPVPERWWVPVVPWAAFFVGLAFVVWLLRRMTARPGAGTAPPDPLPTG